MDIIKAVKENWDDEYAIEAKKAFPPRKIIALLHEAIRAGKIKKVFNESERTWEQTRCPDEKAIADITRLIGDVVSGRWSGKKNEAHGDIIFNVASYKEKFVNARPSLQVQSKELSGGDYEERKETLDAYLVSEKREDKTCME